MNPVIQMSPAGKSVPAVPVSGPRSPLFLKHFCLAQSLAEADVARLERLFTPRRIARGEWLYQTGDDFLSLYGVRFGHFKTVQFSRRGGQSIGGFCMAGDLMAMEAIATGHHTCSAVALEDGEVWEIPFAMLQELLMQIPRLLQGFHRAMSREIEREQGAMLFLSHMHADQRLALFLLMLADRYALRGFSATRFQLRMSREDIAGYLGLTVESVSRQLSRLRRNGSIMLSKRDLRIMERAQLEALAAGDEAVQKAAA